LRPHGFPFPRNFASTASPQRVDYFRRPLQQVEAMPDVLLQKSLEGEVHGCRAGAEDA